MNELQAAIKKIELKFKKVEVALVGEDGNAYAIMSRVSKALKRAGHTELAALYMSEATSGNYDHLLQVSMEFCEDPQDEDDEE